MDWKEGILLSFLIVGIFLILGCNGKQKQQTNMTYVTHKVGYGFYSTVSMTPNLVYPGTPITISIDLTNDGDYPAKLERVELLGSTVMTEGDIVQDNIDADVLPGNKYTVIFNLQVRNWASGTLSLYPAVCYFTNSSAGVSFDVTSSVDIYQSSLGTPPTTWSSRSPLVIKMNTTQGIYLAQKKEIENETKYYSLIQVEISFSGKGSYGWPVKSCDDINTKTFNAILSIYYPKDGTLCVKNGKEYLNCDGETCEIKNDNDVCGVNGTLIAEINETYSRDMSKFYLTIEYLKDSQMARDNIRVGVDASYHFYEIMELGTVQTVVQKV